MPRGSVVTRNPVAGIATLLGILASYVGVVTDLAFVMVFVPMFTFVAASAWFAWYRPRHRKAELTVGPDGVSADGRLLASRRLLRAGDAAARADGRWQIDLHRWIGERVRLVVDTADDARDMLAALGFDRRVGTSTFRVQKATALSLDIAVFATLTTLAISSVAAGMLESLWPFLAPLAVVLYAIVVRREQRLTVGADGVTLGRRFIPFSRIRHVGPGVTDAQAFEIWVEPEERILLDASPERLRAGTRRDHVRDLVHDAWLLAKRSPGTNAASLLRGDRGVKEWVVSLRTNQGGSYRVASVDDDELLAIVTDAGATQEARAGAAVALAAKPEHAPRLRVAADDVADPIVRRIALAALDDEAHLEAELEQAFLSK